MHTGTSPQGLAVVATALFSAIVLAVLGARAARWDEGSARSRFVIATVMLALTTLVFFRVASPVVGYGMMCLALVSVYLSDLLREEHARRRRVASLTPRPVAEAIPTVWVAIAAASALMLAPYVILGQQRAAALIVGACALVMAGIAWRIASAPVQLQGDDLRSERTRDRASRIRKTGMTAVVAIGSIYVFIGFVNPSLPTVLPLQRMFFYVSPGMWLGLLAWVMWYWYYLDRTSCSPV